MTSALEIVRASGIGASEIAAVLNISPFGDPWTVYASKHNLIEPPVQTPEMFWGKTLEPVIASVFSVQMDRPIEWWDRRIGSPQRPWQFASPDAFILDRPEGQRIGILECKTCGLRLAGEWDRNASDEDGVPEHVVAQAEWQMSVTGLPFAYVAVLIAGNDFRVYRVEHDPVREEILLEAGEEFWRKYVMTKTEPPMSCSERAREYLRKRYPREREKLRRATPEEAEWLDEYAGLRRRLALIEDHKAALENQITSAIADAEGLQWERGKFTWKRTKDRFEINWEELAKHQLVGYSEEEQQNLKQQFTETVRGVRRIYFHDKAAA